MSVDIRLLDRSTLPMQNLGSLLPSLALGCRDCQDVRLALGLHVALTVLRSFLDANLVFGGSLLSCG